MNGQCPLGINAFLIYKSEGVIFVCAYVHKDHYRFLQTKMRRTYLIVFS